MTQLYYVGGEVCLYNIYEHDNKPVIECNVLSDDELLKLKTLLTGGSNAE